MMEKWAWSGLSTETPEKELGLSWWFWPNFVTELQPHPSVRNIKEERSQEEGRAGKKKEKSERKKRYQKRTYASGRVRDLLRNLAEPSLLQKSSHFCKGKAYIVQLKMAFRQQEFCRSWMSRVWFGNRPGRWPSLAASIFLLQPASTTTLVG